MARMKQVQRKPNYLAPKGDTIVNISKTFKALHKLQLQSNVKLTGGIKEPRNWRPSSSALLEIRRYQRTTNLLIPKLSFQRIVKSLTNERFEGIRFQTSALHALQVFDLNIFYCIMDWAQVIKKPLKIRPPPLLPTCITTYSTYTFHSMYIFDSFCLYWLNPPPPPPRVECECKEYGLKSEKFIGKNSFLICFTGRPNVINIRDSMWI